MARRWRTAGRVAAIGVLAFLLSACLKLDVDLQVNADNTVGGAIIFGVDKQLLELSGSSIEDVLDTTAPIPEDVEGVTTEPFEDDRFAGQRFTFEGVPLEEFSSGDLAITRDGDVFTVNGVLDLSSGLSGATGLSGLSGPFGNPEELFRNAEMRVRITFPGEVTEANGEVDGNSVTWVPVVGERLEIQATASAVDSGDSNLTLLLIIGAIVLAAAIAIGIVMSRRRAAPAAAGAADPAAGEGTAPAPPGQASPPPMSPTPQPPPSPPPPTSSPPPSPPSPPSPPPPD
jgi:hypothetical protein